MLRNEESRGAGRRTRLPGNVASQADTPEIAPDAHEIQTARLRARYDFSPSLASAVAALIYPQVDSWQGRI